jgi:type IV secretion system protein VirB10
MRALLGVLLISTLAAAQGGSAASVSSSSDKVKAPDTLTIPAGAQIPLALKQAISTKTAREGDPVYASTTFPFVIQDRVLVPAGTYVQGRISSVKRAGRVHGRAEVLMHFTSLIYPNGYTVLLPGSVENVPGAGTNSVKGQEGTIQSDSQTGQKVGTAATTAATGAAIGGLNDGWKGAGIGGGIGAAAGTAIAMLTRGHDVTLDVGTGINMVVQRPIKVDATRVSADPQVPAMESHHYAQN